jgi:hypothetical protein
MKKKEIAKKLPEDFFQQVSLSRHKIIAKSSSTFTKYFLTLI